MPREEFAQLAESLATTVAAQTTLQDLSNAQQGGRRVVNVQNHFAEKCRSSGATASKEKPHKSYGKKKRRDRVGTLEDTAQLSAADTLDRDYTWTVVASGDDGRPVFPIHINDCTVNMLADSGSTCNILSWEDYVSLPVRPPLRPTSVLFRQTAVMYH